MPHRFWGFVRVILLRQFHQSFGSSRFDGIIKFLGKNWWVSSLIVWVIGLVSQLQFDWAFDTEVVSMGFSLFRKLLFDDLDEDEIMSRRLKSSTSQRKHRRYIRYNYLADWRKHCNGKFEKICCSSG
ncbi:uncharacterized protein LOC112008915 [Quercus suber]|uniref:uncharacterized protein LOC112008915 n=1 Tax=Quercus suber TaxID=58331 RepID=UPI000CE1E179|nr:uncharacterized protein LOC112008915 isoform X1 [Quercus suber]